MANDKAPHKAIVTLNAAVYEARKDGQLHPDPKETKGLVLTTTGKDRAECMEKLLDGLRKVHISWTKD